MLSTCTSCVGTWQAYRNHVITLCMYMYVRQCYAFGCICLCVYVISCVWPLENLSILYYLLAEFKHLPCGFLHSLCCTDLAIHASSNKTQRSPSLQIFCCELTAPLGSAYSWSYSGTGCVLQQVFQLLFHNSYTVIILDLYAVAFQTRPLWDQRLFILRT